jgi:Flp pilus assembly protein TadG
MVEFALVLPILLLLLLGIIQFGIVFNNYLAVTDAVRAGARTAAVSRLDRNRNTTVQNQVKDAAENLDTGKLAITITSTWQPGDDVKVTASYPYQINLLGVVVKSGRVSSTTTERVE